MSDAVMEDRNEAITQLIIIRFIVNKLVTLNILRKEAAFGDAP